MSKTDPKLVPNLIFDAEALEKPLDSLLEHSWRLLEPKKKSLDRSWAVLGRSWSRKHPNIKPGYHRTGSGFSSVRLKICNLSERLHLGINLKLSWEHPGGIDSVQESLQQKTAREHSKPPRAPDALARALRALAGRLELGELLVIVRIPENP